MTPYYEDGMVTIYHGDCLEIVDALTFSVIVTDPPYGIQWTQHGGGRNGKTRGSRRHQSIAGDSDTSVRDTLLARVSVPAAVFGSFRAPAPPRVKQTLVYQKTPDAGLMGSVTGFRTDAEPIFLVGPWPVREVRWSSVIPSTVGLQRLQAESQHPHAKPSDVLVRLLDACPAGVVLDPFMGSGSTLVAAKWIGRKAIGVEIEERYCEIAVGRLRQEVLSLEGTAWV